VLIGPSRERTCSPQPGRHCQDWPQNSPRHRGGPEGGSAGCKTPPPLAGRARLNTGNMRASCPPVGQSGQLRANQALKSHALRRRLCALGMSSSLQRRTARHRSRGGATRREHLCFWWSKLVAVLKRTPRLIPGRCRFSSTSPLNIPGAVARPDTKNRCFSS
jgi:hypothetical protein